MMKARRDVPPYLSWVFLLQTSLQCVKDGSEALFLRLFPPPPPLSFLPLTGFLEFTPFVSVQDVTQMLSVKTVQAMMVRPGRQVTMSDRFLTSQLPSCSISPSLLSNRNEVQVLWLFAFFLQTPI